MPGAPFALAGPMTLAPYPAHAHIVLSAKAPRPGSRDRRFAAAAGPAVQEAVPVRHNSYKVPLTKALVRNPLKALTCK